MIPLGPCARTHNERMAKAVDASVTSTPAVLVTAGASGSEVVIGPPGRTGIYLGGSDLAADGSHGWECPASVPVTIRLGISEALYGVCSSSCPWSVRFLATDGGLA